jgi:cell division protein ZapA (FtsZ GTPase activity inhibitor)
MSLRRDIDKRLQALEAVSKPSDPQDLLFVKALAAHYDRQELQLTPEERRELETTEKQMRDEGYFQGD